MDLMKPVEDNKNSLTLDLIANVSGILVASTVGDPTGITAAVIPKIINEVIHQVIFPLTTQSESKRLYQWGKQAAEGIAQELKNGKEFRKDGFFQEIPTNRSNFEEVVESTLKKVKDTTEEPKIKFMANLTKNVHFDQNLDIDTYRQILKALDELSYRQLCIIRLKVLCENQVVTMHPIGYAIDYAEQDEQTRFYSISRDFEKLVDNHYIEMATLPRDEETNEPILTIPSYGQLPSYTRELYFLASLYEIPIEDIIKIFSLWGVEQVMEE